MRHQALQIITAALIIGTASTTWASASTQAADLSAGLVAHFKLDGDGVDAIDSGNNGVVVGLGTTSDRFGVASGAMAFNRNGYISSRNSLLLNGATSAAIAGWVRNRMAANEQGFVVGAGDSRPGQDPFTFKLASDGVVEALFTDTSKGPYHPDRFIGFEGSVGDRRLPRDVWFHFVSQFHSEGGRTTYQLFLNGSLVTEVVYARPHRVLFTQPMPVQLGALTSFTDSQFRGDMDDIRFYGRSLSESEIRALVWSKECDSDLEELLADLQDLVTLQADQIEELADKNARLLEMIESLKGQNADLVRGLDEILRLLRLPPGKRSSTLVFEGVEGAKLNAIIRGLTGPPGQTQGR